LVRGAAVPFRGPLVLVLLLVLVLGVTGKSEDEDEDENEAFPRLRNFQSLNHTRLVGRD